MKTGGIAAQVRKERRVSTFTVGSVTEFLGAITSLICNVAGASVLGVEPLHLLWIYATILTHSSSRFWCGDRSAFSSTTRVSSE
jgi:hypothetical protein